MQYIVTAPDGTKLRVNAPDGATEEEAIEYAKAQWKPAPKERKPLISKQELSTAERLAQKAASGDFGALPASILKSAPEGLVRGLVQGAADPSVGLFQLGANAAGMGDKVNEAIAKQNKEYESKRDGGFDLVRMLGNIVSPVSVLTGGAVGVPASAAGRAGVASLMGAAGGAADPVTEGDFEKGKAEKIIAGAILGPLMSGAIDLGAKGAKFVRNAADHLLPGGSNRSAARLANELAGPRRQAIIDALEKAGSDVPGVKMTAGQAATPAGSAEFSALQETAKRIKPSDYADIDAANQAARRAAIQSFGGDKEALTSAIKARKAVSDPLYEAARKGSADIKPVLQEIDTILAKNPGNRELVREITAIRSGLVDAAGNPRANSEEIMSVLPTIKAALKNPENAFIEGNLVGIKEKIASAVPGLSGANKAFSEASKPINQMEVGQFLENKLVNALDSEKAGAFAQAMRDAPGTIKRATGMPRFDDLEQVLTKDQKRIADAVLANLQNESAMSDLAKRGAAATSQAVGESVESIPRANFLNTAATVFNKVVSRLEGKASKATMETLAETMKDPQKMAQLMRTANPQERAVLREAMVRFGIAPLAMEGE